MGAIAAATWRDWRARAGAVAVVLLCLLGVLLTLQRSVWIAAVAASMITLLCVPRLRAWLVPVVIIGALSVLLALTFIPNLSENVSNRASQSVPVWERENMTVAALNMIQTKPLLGFGWGTFTEASGPYFRQSASYPLVGPGIPCHDTYLGFAAELGLIGVTLWLLALLWGVGGTILAGVRSMFTWRMALLAMFLFYLIVIAFVPAPTGFPVLIPWLLAGVVVGERESQAFTGGLRPRDRVEARRSGHRRLMSPGSRLSDGSREPGVSGGAS
jgi:O-antigen ligase